MIKKFNNELPFLCCTSVGFSPNTCNSCLENKINCLTFDELIFNETLHWATKSNFIVRQYFSASMSAILYHARLVCLRFSSLFRMNLQNYSWCHTYCIFYECWVSFSGMIGSILKLTRLKTPTGLLHLIHCCYYCSFQFYQNSKKCLMNVYTNFVWNF